MAYLIDTNVISAAAPGRTDSELADWLDRHSTQLFLSVITIAEIEDGIAKVRRLGASRKAKALSQWLESVLHAYSSRMLPFDLAVARAAGHMSDAARAAGRAPGFPDLAIAATADVHGLTVLTRNLRHFTVLKVPAVDPFAGLPD
ncbi:MAG: type II toxin-antitoxin system VapC family toxin [Rhodospirillaceae bacterium]|nr:type II toxin-antitoxin system VapC family toxin [Rhodospirillaceae bacterium]